MESGQSPRISGEGFLLESRSREWERSQAPDPLAKPAPPRPPGKRIYRVAFWLALATIVSTFWAGVGAWEPYVPFSRAFELESFMPIRRALLANWWGGLQFSAALMAILVAHELGHYILTIIYKVPSTPPLFIPFPVISPIGTMGAVIMMQSGTADRKQIFDIGLAGPLAGLVVACPIIIFGILNPSPVPYAPGETLLFGQPLLIQWLAAWLVPEAASEYSALSNAQISPFLMAGWVGLLVTGLNMMPLGQLDGGHVAFGLLGPGSYWVAVGALVTAVAFMLYTQVVVFSLMLFLVFLMGLKHPPSSDDSKSLGIPRQIIGWTSLVLPVLCIPANPLSTLT